MRHSTLLDQLAAAGMVSAAQDEDGNITVTIAAGFADPRDYQPAPRAARNAFGELQRAILAALPAGEPFRIQDLYAQIIPTLPVPNKRDTRTFRVQRALEQLQARGAVVIRDGKVQRA